MHFLSTKISIRPLWYVLVRHYPIDTLLARLHPDSSPEMTEMEALGPANHLLSVPFSPRSLLCSLGPALSGPCGTTRSAP